MKVFIVDMLGCVYPDLGYQIKSAFEQLGHSASTFNYRKWRLQHFSVTNKLLNNLIVNKAKIEKPDLVMVHKGETVLSETIRKIKSENIKVVNWNPDEPFGEIQKFNNIKNIEDYDAFFTYDKQYLKRLQDRNPNSYYLPAGADPFGVHKEYIPLKKRTYPSDICLVGTSYPNRITLLSHFQDYSVSVAGPGWDKVPFIKSPKTWVKIPDMVKMFNDSKIVINPYGASKSFIVPNPRTFEIPATRSLELTDAQRDVGDFFKIKKEIVVYKDEADFKELVDYYIENKDDREKIAQAGYERVIKEHTVKHRISKMLEIVKKL